MQAVQLVALAVGALALSSVTSCLWIWTRERNVLEVRKQVHGSGTARSVQLDSWLHSLGKPTSSARHPRSPSDSCSNMYLMTTQACLALGFTHAWALTLVILSAVSALILIQAFSQATASLLLHTERTLAANTARLIDCVAGAIATVKAFSTQSLELRTASAVFNALNGARRTLTAVWGLTSALGPVHDARDVRAGLLIRRKLVREGSVDPGDVMAVFWACLIATSNLPICIPQPIVLAKGKEAARALLEMARGARTGAVLERRGRGGEGEVREQGGGVAGGEAQVDEEDVPPAFTAAAPPPPPPPAGALCWSAGVEGERARLTKKMSRRHLESAEDAPAAHHHDKIPTFWATVKTAWPTIPHKPVVLLGLLVCALSSSVTPLFSFLLSLLLFEVSTGGLDTALINRFGGLVLGIAGLDGVLIGFKYFGMESAALAWITTGVLMACMLGVELVWAMARGWEFTLVGLRIAPVLAGGMSVQTMLVAGCETRNKRAREKVARAYYEAVRNVKAVRVMLPFEGVFRGFEEARRRRWGPAPAIYVGVVLSVKRRSTYLQMVEALNLVVFAVTIGLAAHGIHPNKMAKSIEATRHFSKLLILSSNKPSDSTGSLRPIFANGNATITFSNVQFTYPSRPDVPCSAVPTSPTTPASPSSSSAPLCLENPPSRPSSDDSRKAL
ncbi:putative ABC transporter transmembrane region [Lyophyllum shimeji]|uniref:ABC transporter transmembrane region n=1 Tax=Lyophyllum shimeji TaxID=47721 RepID=A0A9P3UT75_LYOSH|nr:putative ABC transporter transmembrane region [Lyophyllum shimeji]